MVERRAQGAKRVAHTQTSKVRIVSLHFCSSRMASLLYEADEGYASLLKYTDEVSEHANWFAAVFSRGSIGSGGEPRNSYAEYRQ